MPTNLPPDYYEAERRFREAESIDEKIARLEEMMSLVPKHKGTDKLRADLRRRLSQLRRAPRSHKAGARYVSPYAIGKEGAGQVVLIGAANTGKSALVSVLTHAKPEVAPYPFTTWEPTPGMMPYGDIQIQLVDTPPLNADYVEPGLLDLIRRADLVLIVVDLQANPVDQFEETMALFREHRILPQRDLEAYGPEAGTYVPMMIVANKSDDEASDELFELFCLLLEDDWLALDVSATTGRHLDLLKQRVFDRLGVIRVYSKPPGRPPDMDAPFTLEQGSTVSDLAAKVHRDFYDQLKAARVWGAGVYDGQMVSRDHVLADGDVVELHV